MELNALKKGKILHINAVGRLDASWSDYFTDTFLGYIRNGDHELVINAAEIHFLSSAGIRSLVRIHKELMKLNGRFQITNANEFVVSTLQMTGFGMWLTTSVVQPDEEFSSEIDEVEKLPENCYALPVTKPMTIKKNENWIPWKKVDSDHITHLHFPSNTFGLGIGSPVSTEAFENLLFGDFLAACGNVVYQRPEEKSKPDYLLKLENYVPDLYAIQSWYAEGEMSHLLRFTPNEDGTPVTLSDLVKQTFAVKSASQTVFVILAEIDGLVGAHLIQSPTKIGDSEPPSGLKMRDWLSFSGERIHAKEQALVVGIASNSFDINNSRSNQSPSSLPGLAIHAHAAVFPYQPLQNGQINLEEQVQKFLNGPPPKALLHLIEDNRPGNGLGESSFIRGAIWFASVKPEEAKQ